ncbi:hypothetical protein GCM10023094_35310 [Rhodococcus olei]|uniref:Uncharacterized protein n=1 Tax=Rhodococcus olei TaxID=2161675 RepID=A0ABP8PBN5_9NOCA
MFTNKTLGWAAALIATVGALPLAMPATASAAPVPFIPSSISSCAPGEWLTFNADRVGAAEISYTTAAPMSKWYGAVVMWTNLTTGFQGIAFLNAPPAVVGLGPVVSQVAGLLPCSVSSGVVIT